MQAARLEVVAPLLEVLKAPPAGYATAMATYARAVLAFMREPAMRDIFNDTAIGVMAQLAAGASPRVMRVVKRLSQATDQALAANARLYATRRALRGQVASGSDDLEAIGRAAIAMLEAEDALDQVEG